MEGFNQAGFHDNIPQELLKYIKQQNLSPVPLLPALQEIQDNMDDVLSRTDLRDDEKAKRYLQLQNRYFAFKEQLSSRKRPKEISNVVPELPSTQESSTATSYSPLPLTPFNVTPDLKQVTTLQKPETERSTPRTPNSLFPDPSSHGRNPITSTETQKDNVYDAHGKQ